MFVHTRSVVRLGAISFRTFHGTIHRLSNNSAEIAAIFFALAFVLSQPPGQTYLICFDSKVAAFCVRQFWRASRNLSLVRIASALYVVASAHSTIRFHWIKGHSGSIGNDAADSLSKRGAHGDVLTLKHAGIS